MRLSAVLIAAALLATSNMALAQKAEDVTETINLFKGIPQVAPFFGKSYGYAVWPRIGRGGLGIGGAGGKGQVFQGGHPTGLATLTVRDDGAGFPADWQAKGGSGLRRMRERVEAVGGRMWIESTPGNGATLRVTARG
mgnify:CR=1 FL=1